MKKQIVLLVVVGFAAAISAQAQSTLNIYLSDAGDDQTSISWNMTGDIVGSGMVFAQINIAGVGGLTGFFTNYLNGFAITNSSFKITGGGTLSDPTGGLFFSTNTALPIQAIEFQNVSGNELLGLQTSTAYPPPPSGSIGVHYDDSLFYTPGIDSATLNMPFTDFNPGTYQFIQTAEFTTTFTENLFIGGEPAPEPSAIALAGLGLAGLIAARRNK